MKIQFQADEDLRRAIVLGVRRREPAISFVQAFEIDAEGKNDFEALRAAADSGRILVSHDVRTMPQHFRQFTSRWSSPGVILVPQKLSLSIVIEELVIIWIASEAEEWVNQVRFLPL